MNKLHFGPFRAPKAESAARSSIALAVPGFNQVPNVKCFARTETW